jgi:hypothetical protein
MEIYNESSKTKTGELRVTRPIGALVVKMSQAFSALTNETITVFVERANGNNSNLMTDIPLKAFIAASVAGNPALFSDDTTTTALCELCEEGSIDLQENESLKIKLDGLKSSVTYALFGMEYPVSASSGVKISRKNILAGETERIFDVPEEELMLIDGVDAILELNVTFENGHTCKYVPEELKAISRDFDPVKMVTIGSAAKTDYDLPNLITYPLLGVIKIDVKKSVGVPVNLYLKNDVATFNI